MIKLYCATDTFRKSCFFNRAPLFSRVAMTCAGRTEETQSLELMLKQLFAVLTECVAQPVENLSLLGCSCIRYCSLYSFPRTEI